MSDHDYPEHYADSAWSAIEFAEQLKESGQYDLFRGQRHTYDIQPSVLRAGVDTRASQEQLNNFAIWVHATPDLNSLHGKENAILAVAQHYGLRTPLLDFSRAPRIAGFFATDGGEEGDTGTIICLNKKRFNNSWSDINRRHSENTGILLTEIIDIDVRNLWRLHAQEGEFLRCHVDPSFLEMFSYFLHIYFPQRFGTTVAPTECIYPVDKSHLEVLLDQYFLIDSYPERNQRLEEFFGSVISISADSVKKAVESFFKDKVIPRDHESWGTSDAAQWLVEPDEQYNQHVMSVDAQLTFPKLDELRNFEAALEGQLIELLRNDDPKMRGSLQWSVVDDEGHSLYVNQEGITNDGSDEFTEFSVAEMVSAIYSGMRYLPYEAHHISRAIVRYFTMLSFDVHKMIKDYEGVEFSGGGVRGRGFASKNRIRESLRDDFFELIDPKKFNSKGTMDFRDVLLASRFVRSSYQFDKFVELVVEDLIPSQAAVAVEGLVIGLNPRRIEVFGES